MNTLRVIQTIAKVFSIIFKVLFILCVVGSAGCAVGIITLACVSNSLIVEGKTIQEIIETNANVSIGTLYAYMAAAMILVAAQAVLFKFAEAYLVHERQAGTPFTMAGSKELLRLGILSAAIPLGATILASIVYSILKATLPNVADYNISNYGSLVVGLVLIVFSLVCRHGAETFNPTVAPDDAQTPSQNDVR